MLQEPGQLSDQRQRRRGAWRLEILCRRFRQRQGKCLGLDAADQIGKTADRAGLSTQSLQEMRHAFDLGADDVIKKPFPPVLLLQRLGRLMSR